MFEMYYKEIEKLNSFEKSDIITEKFKLYSKNKMEMYYAPHNEYINKSARIFIVGICPGWTQMQISYKTANQCLKNNLEFSEIQKLCKQKSRFAGSMRKNLIDMLNQLELHRYFEMESCSELFSDKDYLLHTTSVLPFPVFINGKNYTGHTPDILNSKILADYIEKYFYPEAQMMHNTLIIPLGKSVDKVFADMVNKNILKPDNIMFGFPHTSGANGHRNKQFEENKDFFTSVINNYFNNK